MKVVSDHTKKLTDTFAFYTCFESNQTKENNNFTTLNFTGNPNQTANCRT